VLEQLATAGAQLEAIRGLRSGRLRVSAFPSALATFVPPSIAQFRSRHPDVRVELVEAEPDTSLPSLRAGEVDLAITYQVGETAEETGLGLDFVPLLDDEQRAVLPSRHRLASRKSISLASLAAEPWIVPRADGSAGGYRELLEDLCAQAGFAPQIAFETDDLQAVQAFVGAGLGIALMHDLTLPVLRRSVAVKPLTGQSLTRRVTAVTAAGRRSPAAAAMLEVLAGS
jgi:DNA-binding transcriptional LysR family regulator